MEQRLAEQRAKLERARREQRAAHERALRMLKGAGLREDMGSMTEAGAGTGGKFREELLAGLHGTDGLRKAVLYRELLDPPLGLR